MQRAERLTLQILGCLFDPVLSRALGQPEGTVLYWLLVVTAVGAFATAVHLAVDLRTGTYVLGSAGHPPAGRFLAGSGRWGETDASGTALGIAHGATFTYASGTIAPGDAVPNDQATTTATARPAS